MVSEHLNPEVFNPSTTYFSSSDFLMNKGPFTNYVDKILAFFDHLITPLL